VLGRRDNHYTMETRNASLKHQSGRFTRVLLRKKV